MEEPVISDLTINSVFDIASFLREGETSISGEEACRRAMEMGGNLGEFNTEFFEERQDQIPEEWRPYYLVFPDTIQDAPLGSRFVRCLFYFMGRWRRSHRWLDDEWYSDGRVLVPCKAEAS